VAHGLRLRRRPRRRFARPCFLADQPQDGHEGFDRRSKPDADAASLTQAAFESRDNQATAMGLGLLVGFRSGLRPINARFTSRPPTGTLSSGTFVTPGSG
jgi:hypothetical protein